MKRFTVYAAAIAAAFSVVAGSYCPAVADPATLQSDVIGLTIAGATSAVARTVDHGQVAAAVSGTAAYPQVVPVSVDTQYRTGSVTKTFVSTVVLQLVGEGALSLDDTVDRWLPGLVNANGNDGTKITVRQLLQHTSGLPEYVDNPAFFDTLQSADAFNASKYRHYSPQDLINLAVASPPVFAPGTGWSYSNTNYVLAGLIVQAATGNTWDTEVRARILNPLGLVSTTIPAGDDATMPSPFAHAYNIWTAKPQRIYTDTTEDNMTWADSAGKIITTTADETRFFSALLRGQLLKPAQLAAMKQVMPLPYGFDYGLGIAHTTMCGKDMWWHDGEAVGYGTWAGTNTDGSSSLAYNVATTDLLGSDAVFDRNVAAAKDTLVRHWLCGPNYRGTEPVGTLSRVIRGKSIG